MKTKEDLTGLIGPADYDDWIKWSHRNRNGKAKASPGRKHKGRINVAWNQHITFPKQIIPYKRNP